MGCVLTLLQQGPKPPVLWLCGWCGGSFIRLGILARGLLGTHWDHSVVLGDIAGRSRSGYRPKNHVPDK